MSKEEMLWYSSFSTGIFEVDNQHGNIDIMLQLLDETVPAEKPNKLSEIIQAIETHFEYEESLLGEAFPREHFQAHERFITLIKNLIELVIDNSMTIARFVGVIRSELVEHVQSYDVKIKELL